MKNRLILGILVVLLVGILAVPVSANVTISFRDVNAISHNELHFYTLDAGGNWTLAGIWNSTSSGVELEDGVYVVDFQPSAANNILSQPVQIVQGPIDYITEEDHWGGIIVLVVLLGMVAIITRRK